MQIRVAKTHPKAEIPKYATDGSACFDLHALPAEDVFNAHEMVYGAFVQDCKPKVFRTGLKFEVPEGYVMLIFSRSGHGFKNDTRLANCVGVIDSDYRGEVMVKLTTDRAGMNVKPNDRIAQALLFAYNKLTFQEVQELSKTERGTGGLGSTGTGRNFIGMPKENENG